MHKLLSTNRTFHWFQLLALNRLPKRIAVLRLVGITNRYVSIAINVLVMDNFLLVHIE